MKAILVANPKGGCGKTTIATNLASYYALWGVNTAIIDYDTQASSIEWVAARPSNVETITAIEGVGRTAFPEGAERVLIDAPARTDRAKLQSLLRRADVLLVPILPSPIDIRAAAHFIGEVLFTVDSDDLKIGIIANRVREHTVIYSKLQTFMKAIKIPFVTHLRDSQNYIRSAEYGIGIFEMAPYQVRTDLEEWRPLITWIEKK